MSNRQSLPLPDVDTQMGVDGCGWTHRSATIERAPLPGQASEDWERDRREARNGAPRFRWRIAKEYHDGTKALYPLRLYDVDEGGRTVLKAKYDDHDSLQAAQEAAGLMEAGPPHQPEPLGFVPPP